MCSGDGWVPIWILYLHCNPTHNFWLIFRKRNLGYLYKNFLFYWLVGYLSSSSFWAFKTNFQASASQTERISNFNIINLLVTKRFPHKSDVHIIIRTFLSQWGLYRRIIQHFPKQKYLPKTFLHIKQSMENELGANAWLWGQKSGQQFEYYTQLSQNLI